MNAPRSGCPINLTVEALGDRWSEMVIRDLTFGKVPYACMHCKPSVTHALAAASG